MTSFSGSTGTAILLRRCDKLKHGLLLRFYCDRVIITKKFYKGIVWTRLLYLNAKYYLLVSMERFEQMVLGAWQMGWSLHIT